MPDDPENAPANEEGQTGPVVALPYRIVVSVAALSLAGVHLLWPHVNIDAITLGLFVLALLPWMALFLKNADIPGIGKFEFREVFLAARKAENKAEIAYQIASASQARTAVQTTQESAGIYDAEAVVVSVESQLQELEEQYKRIRDAQNPGPARTAVMTSVVGKMIALAPRLEKFDTREALLSPDAGRRLAAYAWLYARPNLDFLGDLVTGITSVEKHPFGRYWGLLALEKVLQNMSGAKPDKRLLDRLEAFLRGDLKRGTDEYYVLDKILKSVYQSA